MLKRLSVLLGAALASNLGAPAIGAQAYPSRPVRIVVPFAPSGGVDLIARLMGENLGARWSQPVIIDNRAGGNSVIGTDVVAKAPADGYTLLSTASVHSAMPSLHRNLPFDPIRDFDAIALFAITPGMLLVHPSVPVNSVQELIAYAKARPGQLNYGSAGFGGSAHLGAELFKFRAGLDIKHIPYKGAGPALIDLLGGQVQMMFGNFAPSLPYAQSGKLRALAVTSAQRVPLAPNLPTVAESGLPGFEVSVWFGMVGPRGMPKQVIDKINKDVAALQHVPRVEKSLETLGFDAANATPQEFKARIVEEVDKWGKLVRQAKLIVD
jgi:tripartite-type tricarboxylate transporter receptor subunit TctC